MVFVPLGINYDRVLEDRTLLLSLEGRHSGRIEALRNRSRGPRQQLKLVVERLKAAGKGIILFHDPRAQTAAMLPAFLRYLRDNHYRVVHVVPAASGPNIKPDALNPK